MPPRPLIRDKCKKCRDRKIKCDNQRPCCGPCLRSSLECRYQDPTTFINYSASTSPNQSGTPLCRTQDGKLRKRQPTVNRCRTSRPSPSSAEPSPTLQVALSSLQIDKEALANGFLIRYYPEDSHLWIDTCSWIFPALDGLEYAPLSAASTALGFAMMGFTTDNERSKKQSVACYINSMEQLRVACQHSARYWFKNILTCLLLLSYENIHPTFSNAKTTNSHMLGLASLMQLGGPEAFQDGHEHQVFAYARFLLLVGAARTGIRSFLAQPEWMEAPWGKIKKNKLHKCLDCVAEIPDLQQQLQHILINPPEESDNSPDLCCLAGSTPSSSSLAAHLLRGIIDLSTRLDQWCAMHERPQNIFEVIGPRPAKEECRPFVPNVQDHAAKISIWTARICLQDITWRLARHFSGQPEILACSEHIHMVSRLHENAVQVAEESMLLLPLVSKREQGLVGVIFAAEFLNIAAAVFERFQFEERKRECLKYRQQLQLSSTY